MEELENLLSRIQSLYTPVCINGKDYPGNNPYVMNNINNLLQSGKLKVKDIKYDEAKLELRDSEKNGQYFYYPALEQISIDIDNEYNWIRDSKRRP